MKIIETPLYRLEIILDNLGNLFIDTSSIQSEGLRKVLDKWSPEYENTETLCLISREAQRLGLEFKMKLEETLNGL